MQHKGSSCLACCGEYPLHTCKVCMLIAVAERSNRLPQASTELSQPSVLQFKAKLEQLAVKSARYDGLHRELEEAQAQLAAECAHRQVCHTHNITECSPASKWQQCNHSMPIEQQIQSWHDHSMLTSIRHENSVIRAC